MTTIKLINYIISKLKEMSWDGARDIIRWCIIVAMLLVLAYAYWTLYTGVNSGVLPAPGEFKLLTPETLAYKNRISLALFGVFLLGLGWFVLTAEKWGLFKYV